MLRSAVACRDEVIPMIDPLYSLSGFAVGFLVFTLMLKVAVPISLGEFLRERRHWSGERSRENEAVAVGMWK